MPVLEKTMSTKRRPPHMPADTPDYAIGAWLSGLEWAIGKQEVLQEFLQAHGLDKDTPFAQTKAHFRTDDALFKAWAEWFNKNIWGPWK